jgi:hypothetical protein
MESESRKPRAGFEAGEHELVEGDDRKAAHSDRKGVMVEERDAQERQREQDKIDGNSEQKNGLDHSDLGESDNKQVECSDDAEM